MSDAIQASQDCGVLVLRLNRPDKKNALTRDMYQSLVDGIRSADENPAIRAVLITGTPGCFTSGNDLNDFLQSPPDSEDSSVVRFLHAISHSKKPLVAAVTGLAVGVGVTLLLHCELVIMSREAKLQLPFTRLGLCPEAASSLLLPARAGYAKAAEWLLLGEPFSAEEAHRYGLANALVDTDQVETQAMAYAQRLAALPPQALYASKALLRQGQRAAVESTMRDEMTQFMQMLRAPEAMEAMMAFMQKRAPDFSRFS